MRTLINSSTIVQRKTRLAPSPTGALHLGNARSFLVNWLLARQNNWSIQLRIEDLDGPRIKHDAADQAIEDLRWLGIDWDGEPVSQSPRLAQYRETIDYLLSTRMAYPCICSRRETESAASAPHSEDGSHRYPGTCRGRFQSMEAAREASGRAPAIRFAVPNGSVEFVDEFSGLHRFDVADQLGDFIIAKADGSPAYQLAVVVDDADARITDVVRGDDLLESAARQILLYRALHLESSIPRYTHLPLVVGPDGRRLAKRHGDSRLSHYRELGVQPEHVLAMLAKWCGISDVPDKIAARDLIGKFDLSKTPRGPITFSKEDEAALLSGRV